MSTGTRIGSVSVVCLLKTIITICFTSYGQQNVHVLAGSLSKLLIEKTERVIVADDGVMPVIRSMRL